MIQAAATGNPLNRSMARLDTHEIGAELRTQLVPQLLEALKRLYHEIQSAEHDVTAQSGRMIFTNERVSSHQFIEKVVLICL